jgi:CHAD domain-containing protein
MECIGKAIAALTLQQDRDVAIHSIRKQCKQARALIRLFHDGPAPARRQAGRLFRDIGRTLSAARDARVALNVHAALLERYGPMVDPVAITSARGSLDLALQSLHTALGEPTVGGDELHRKLLAARVRVRHAVVAAGTDETLCLALVRAYRRARRAARIAADSGRITDFHEARKRAKDYCYQLEVLAGRWPSVAASRIGPVRRLTELLGDAQDCEVFCMAISRRVAGCSETTRDLLLALAHSRAQALRDDALRLSLEVFSEKSRAFAAALGQSERLLPEHRAAG